MEVELTSNTSKALALANILINGVESLIFDCNCSDAYIDVEFSSLEDLLGSDINVNLSGCEYRPDEYFELDDLIDYGLVSSVNVSLGSSGINYRVLYDEAIKTVLRWAIPYMRLESLKTKESGVEYMLVVLRDGRAEVLEGEVDRVVIPEVDAVVTVHTHSTLCTPSTTDMKSLTNLLINGGLGFGVVSPVCYLLIFRVGPFTEEDLITLKNLDIPEELTVSPRKYLSNDLVVITGY